MLQYFIDNKYNSIFEQGFIPKLEYLSKIDEISSRIPRAMHQHKNLVEILLVYNGNGIHTINQDRYITEKGDLIFYNSGVLHDEIVGEKNSNWGTYCLAVNNLKLHHLALNEIIPADYCPVINSGEHFHEILELFRILEGSVIKRNKMASEFNNYIARALIVKFCEVIQEKCSNKQEKKSSLSAKVKIFIDKFYKEDINLAIIAKAVNANRYYMSHLFKAETNFSPMQYVMRLRLGEAQNLLINTDLNITEIATAVGYNDSNYFQKVFRKNVGLTPGDYRRKWRA